MILEVRMQRNEIRLITVQDDANVHDVRLKIEEICSICLDDQLFVFCDSGLLYRQKSAFDMNIVPISNFFNTDKGQIAVFYKRSPRSRNLIR